MSSPFAIRKIRSPAKRNRFGKFGEIAKSLRPTVDTPLDFKKITPDKGGIITRRRGVTFSKDERGQLEARAVSDEQPHRGSVHERILYKALLDRHMAFDFQPSIEGGRQELGGLVADFIIYGIGGASGLVVQVQGKIWHSGVFAERRDENTAALLQEKGFEVINLWDYTIENETLFNEWMRRYIDFAPISAGTSLFGRNIWTR